MKKIYIEPRVREINIDAKAVMLNSSPTLDSTPGSLGLGTDVLDEEDETLAKEFFISW